jgi:c-di-GMP-binding flagellar brake protein YcgR
MATSTANILAEGQHVQLDLGGATQVLQCLVLGFAGTSVILAATAEAPETTTEALAAGAAAYVIVDADGAVSALRARLRHVSGPDEIVLAITDDFQLGQRRRYSRAPIAIEARLRPLAGGDEWRTVTRDISAGGVRVVATGDAGEASEEHEVHLEAPGLSVRAQAEIVRRTDADLSLRFTAIDDDAASLLQQLSVAYYRLAAERP